MINASELCESGIRSMSPEETDAVSGGAIMYIIEAVLMALGTGVATDADNPWNVGKNPKPCGRGGNYKCG